MAGLLCAIHQPNFLPRLSTLAKLYTADTWIILDDVQFTRRDYQHPCYLTPARAVPIRCPGPDPRDRGNDHRHRTARRRQRARHDHPAPPPELARHHLPQQRHPGPQRPLRTAGRPHQCRRGIHVPVQNGRQPLPRPGLLRRPGTLRRDVHPAAAPGRPSPRRHPLGIRPGRPSRCGTRTALCCHPRTCATVQGRVEQPASRIPRPSHG